MVPALPDRPACGGCTWSSRLRFLDSESARPRPRRYRSFHSPLPALLCASDAERIPCGCRQDDRRRNPGAGARIAACLANRSPTLRRCDCRRCRRRGSGSCLTATALHPTSPANHSHPTRTWLATLEPRRHLDSCTFAALPAVRLFRQPFRGLLTLFLPGVLRERNCDSPVRP